MEIDKIVASASGFMSDAPFTFVQTLQRQLYQITLLQIWADITNTLKID